MPKDLRKFRNTPKSRYYELSVTNCLDFKNSSSSLKLVVLKNNQWENSAVILEKPDFFFNNKLSI